MTKNVLDAARRDTSSNSARAKRGRTRSELTAKRPDYQEVLPPTNPKMKIKV